MFQKRKKFKEEATPESRLADRWDQQVFFMKKSFPHSETQIAKIMAEHSGQDSEFVVTEEALDALANLSSELRGLS